MNKPVNLLRQKNLDHIKSHESSGLSIRNYCEQNNLATHKFSYYKAYNLKPSSVKNDNSFAAVNLSKSANDLKPKNKSQIDPVWIGQFINSLLRSK